MAEAPCGNEECTRALRVLRIKVKKYETLVAELHDRARTLWGAEEKYTDSDLYKKIRQELAQ